MFYRPDGSGGGSEVTRGKTTEPRTVEQKALKLTEHGGSRQVAWDNLTEQALTMWRFKSRQTLKPLVSPVRPSRTIPECSLADSDLQQQNVW